VYQTWFGSFSEEMLEREGTITIGTPPPTLETEIEKKTRDFTRVMLGFAIFSIRWKLTKKMFRQRSLSQTLRNVLGHQAEDAILSQTKFPSPLQTGTHIVENTIGLDHPAVNFPC